MKQSNDIDGRVTRIRAALEALPPKTVSTTRAVVSQVEDAIRDAVAAGYTLNEISAVLHKHGMPVKGATIRQYIGGIRKGSKDLKKASNSVVSAAPSSLRSGEAAARAAQDPRPQPSQQGHVAREDEL